MREFFVYGFKTRGSVGDGCDRKYDNKLWQLKSWMGDYMHFNWSDSGKAQFISVDSREVVHNPLYSAFKTRNFSNYDILLHFCILDVLSENDELPIVDIIDILQNDYFNKMDQEIEIEERTVRNKLEKYVKLGILSQRTGTRKKKYYSMNYDRVVLPSWHDAIVFFSETNPTGVIGSFLLDKKELEDYESCFWYKHHYMLYAIESEIVETIMEGISEKRYLKIVTRGRKKTENELQVFPIKLYVSTQNGREYLLGHGEGMSGLTFVRLDNIRKIETDRKCEKYQEVENEYLSAKPYLWGVIAGNTTDITHIEMTLRVKEDEEFIVRRLEREKKNGQIYRINEQQYKYVVDTYDAMELMPWIRSFVGRIEKLESDNSYLEKKFMEDMQLMYSMYLEGDNDDI